MITMVAEIRDNKVTLAESHKRITSNNSLNQIEKYGPKSIKQAAAATTTMGLIMIGFDLLMTQHIQKILKSI